MGFCDQRMQGQQQDRLGRRRKDPHGGDPREHRRCSEYSFDCGRKFVFLVLGAQVWGVF